jgi:hypothetical protein
MSAPPTTWQPPIPSPRSIVSPLLPTSTAAPPCSAYYSSALHMSVATPLSIVAFSSSLNCFSCATSDNGWQARYWQHHLRAWREVCIPAISTPPGLDNMMTRRGIVLPSRVNYHVWLQARTGVPDIWPTTSIPWSFKPLLFMCEMREINNVCGVLTCWKHTTCLLHAQCCHVATLLKSTSKEMLLMLQMFCHIWFIHWVFMLHMLGPIFSFFVSNGERAWSPHVWFDNWWQFLWTDACIELYLKVLPVCHTW